MAINERITFGGRRHPRNHKNIKFTDEDIQLGRKYLKNPTNAGLWMFEGRWLFDSEIVKDIKETIEQNAPNLEINQRKISVTNHDVESLMERSESISFYLTLFGHLVRRTKEPETLEEYMDGSRDSVIINLLDLDTLTAKYKKALDHFTKRIYSPASPLQVGPQYMTKIESGSLMCPTGPMDLNGSIIYKKHADNGYERGTGIVKTRIKLISLSHQPLNDMAIFLKKLEIVDEPEIYAIFSPEEEILNPYVNILTAMMPHVASRESDGQFFKKMMSDYEDKNYTGCISTAGLVVEDCLTQIYETIYRVPVPRKMMLGSLKQKIGDAAKSRDSKSLSHEDVSRQLMDYKTRNKTDPVRLADIDSKLLLRYIDDKYKKLELRLDSVEGESKNNDFFPTIISMNLEDIIRFRNAVSHKSLDPIGSNEALKSIYCSFSLVAWWDEERRKIDWTRSQEEIIKDFVLAAKNYRG